MWIFNNDNWIEIWETIKSNKMRSFLTSFGVFWGIFILLIMLGASTGLETGLRKTFEGVATNSAFMWSQISSKPYKGYNAGRYWNINNNDINGIRALMPDVKLLAPRIRQRSQAAENVVYRDLKASYSVYGDYPDYFKIIPVVIKLGRTINERDIKEERKVCVIGDKIQDELFKGDNPLGKNLRIDGVYFKIIGVMHPKSNSVNVGGNVNSTVCIPFSTLQKAFGYGNTIDFFCVTAKEGVKVSKLEKSIKKYLLKQHSLAPDDYKAVGSFNMQQEFEKIDGLFIGLNSLSWIVGLGTLLAGIIGVSNIMLIVIKERTKEIGIKRALGAQSGFIRGQILFESALLTLFAGFTGLFVSVVILEIVSAVSSGMSENAFITFEPTVNVVTAFSALAILLIGGVIAGLLPANKAIRIKPIDALRDE